MIFVLFQTPHQDSLERSVTAITEKSVAVRVADLSSTPIHDALH